MSITYLDNASSAIPKFFAKDYGYHWANPNSNHKMGLEAKNALDKARERIKDSLGLKSGKVLFCRSATEAVEWLCRQFPTLWENDYCLDACCYSSVEHSSVSDSSDICIGINEDLKEGLLLTENFSPIMYFHQFCSHITGQIFDIENIGEQVKEIKEVTKHTIFFGSDLTAGITKYPFPKKLDEHCDFLFFSGRKIHCETMGCMWLSDRLFEYLGGSQDSRNEYGLIKGTPNVGGAIALSHAVRIGVKDVESKQKQWNNLVSLLLSKLREHNINAYFAGTDYPRTYAINALCLKGFNADSLVQFLSSRDIYVSPCYSACSENADYHTAIALGMTKEQAEQTIRVSFSEDTNGFDINELVNGIVEFKKLFM